MAKTYVGTVPPKKEKGYRRMTHLTPLYECDKCYAFVGEIKFDIYNIYFLCIIGTVNLWSNFHYFQNYS